MEPLGDQVIRKLGETLELYYRLILVVAHARGGKTTTLQEISARTGAPLINVNLELSRRMLELTDRQRIFQIASILEGILNGTGNDTVILDNTEILFDIALRQDPLRLLQILSRNRIVIAAWNGSVINGQLVYASPEHKEYRKYSIRGFLLSCVDSSAW